MRQVRSRRSQGAAPNAVQLRRISSVALLFPLVYAARWQGLRKSLGWGETASLLYTDIFVLQTEIAAQGRQSFFI